MFPKGKGKYDNTIKLRKGIEQVNEKIIRCLDTFWAFKKVLSLLVPKLRVPTQKRIGGKAVKALQQWRRHQRLCAPFHRCCSPSTPLRRALASKMTGSEVCEGCCEVIYDRFVMRVGNSPWHEDCLFCSECHTPLSNSCYYKEGRLLCRGDYERRFGVKCGRCGQCLLPHDLVMRTRFSIYHIACFVCTVCGTTLNRGDQYVVRAGQVRILTNYANCVVFDAGAGW